MCDPTGYIILKINKPSLINIEKSNKITSKQNNQF